MYTSGFRALCVLKAKTFWHYIPNHLATTQGSASALIGFEFTTVALRAMALYRMNTPGKLTVKIKKTTVLEDRLFLRLKPRTVKLGYLTLRHRGL